ncbi:MAG: tripartite tricarboxylate transporter TctB family protein [Nitrospirae bacterium]|nr:tripartite tricarboxylate transporter TctB family protein [Nitrospirota bacterium]
MAKLNLISAIVFLLVSMWVALESKGLGMGTLSEPGPGFYPFGISVLLLVFSLLLIIQSLIKLFLKNDQEQEEQKEGEKIVFSEGLQDAGFGFEKDKIKRVGGAALLLLVGSLLLDTLGFVLCMFLVVFVLVKIIERESLRFSTIIALCASVLPYVIFDKLVGMQLPQGILTIF